MRSSLTVWSSNSGRLSSVAPSASVRNGSKADIPPMAGMGGKRISGQRLFSARMHEPNITASPAHSVRRFTVLTQRSARDGLAGKPLNQDRDRYDTVSQGHDDIGAWPLGQ